MRILITFLLLLYASLLVNAQDPNFSQFFKSPLSINPALTGNGESNVRIMSNLRSQWIGAGTAYNTQTISVDGKIKKIDENNQYIGLGGMVLQENAMEGAYKATYVSINSSFHLTLDDKGNGLSFGLGAIYQNTKVDFSQLTFDSQLSNSGFNAALPTAENNLNYANSYLSLCAGMMYTYSSDESYLDLGVSGYRFMKTQRSILNDSSQFDNPRYSIHGDYARAISDRVMLNINFLHNIKAGDNLTTLGAFFGFSNTSYDDNKQTFFNIGACYSSRKAIIPYIGYEFSNLQFGLTYDVNISTASSSSVAPKALELSIVWRHFSNNLDSKVGSYHSPF